MLVLLYLFTEINRIFEVCFCIKGKYEPEN